MLVNRAHKIKLDLTKEQAHYCARSAGVARFAYNWTLNAYKTQFQEFKNGTRTIKPSIPELRKEFNSIKKTQFPFTLEISKYCSQDAQMRLERRLIISSRKRLNSLPLNLNLNITPSI